MSFFRFRKAPQKKRKKATAALGSSFRAQSQPLFEALESRNLLTVTLSPIVGHDANSAFDVPSGKDLYVPLTSSDPNQTITYTVTSSDPSLVTTVLTGNPTLQLTVQGVENDGTSFSGTMTIELFQNLAPETVATISNLVNSGFYNGLSFYRIVPDFVIQGGSNGASSTPNFDDEFNASLTFNSPGMLAMANPGTPDSNTSEIFITDTDEPLSSTPQYLNFRHSIFGQLTSGFDIYQDIMNAQGVSDSNSSPTTPVTITSASIITDNQNSVVQISAPNDFTGGSTITVTAHSTDGSSDVQTFTVNMVTPATSNNQPLILAPVEDATTNPGTPITFQVSATDASGSTPTFSITDAESFDGTPANVTVEVTPLTATTASVTLTPAAGFTGTIKLLARADDSSADVHDAQAFSLTVGSDVAITSVSTPINSANVASTLISGTGSAGATISVEASDGTLSISPLTTTVLSDGTWTISGIDVSSLADGTITYTATDVSSEATASSSTTKDTQAPAIGLTSVTNPINLNNSANVTASGTGEIGATISVVISDGTNSTSPLTTTVLSDGNWTISGINASALSDGTVNVLATATDTAGNTSQDSQTATKDTVAPTVAITQVTNPVTLANVTTASASGTGEAGATVSLVASDGVNTTTAYTATIEEDGTWSISGIDVSTLADGTITFSATAADAAGNTAQTSLASTKSAIAITLVTAPINAANASNTSASGTGEAGATVSLVASDGVNTTTAYTATIGEDGTWSISGIDVSALADGTITYTATASDGEDHSAQFTKTATKDTVAPTLGTTTVTNPINLDNADNTVASGTAEVGATISIIATDGTNSTSPQTATVGADGAWSISGINVSSLADGTITYTVTASDAAGNSTQASVSTLKDTLAPDVSITDATDPIDIAGSNSVTVSGTGEVGATISVVANDVVHTTVAVTTTVGADGTWSVTGIDVSPLSDGPITYVATATDAAGNTAQSSKAATKATISVTVVTDPINATNATHASVSGTGQVGATVSLVASDGTNSTSAYTATIAADGTWSISGIDLSALADGTITFTATADDGEGNTAQATHTATKDTAAPIIALTTVTNPIDSSNAANTAASGTGETGATISLVASDGTNSTTAYTTTVGSDGTWSISGIDVSSLKDATITYTATATDGAGNTAQASLSSPKNVASTGSLSGIVYADTNNSQSLDGDESVLAGVILTLTGVDAQGNALPSQTVVTASDGTYSFSGLVAGTYTITQAQPSGLTDGQSIVGTSGGTAGTNTISGIVLAGGAAGTGYNFTELGLEPAMISLKLFLASEIRPAHQLLDDMITQYGVTAPVVMSITKNDADPTTATSVPYTVTFNESVTGVDATDFSVSGMDAAFIDSVTGSDTTYVVTVETGGGSGNLSLSLVDDDSITSGSGAALGGTGTGNGNFVGPSYSLSAAQLAVTIASVTNPINAANATSVTASGTSESGATISLAVTDGTTTSTFSTTVQSDGTWNISVMDLSSLNDGQLTFTATASNSAGESAQGTSTATKDTVAPSVAVSSVTNSINASNASAATASGTAEVGSTISLIASDGSNSTGSYTATVSSDGAWSISDIDVSALADGTITFTVTATDTAGNTAQSSQSASKDSQPPQVAVTQVTDPLTIANYKNAQASGTGEVGATISLVASDGTHNSTAYTATVGEDGTWSISALDTSNLADGTITFTATARDTTGNTAQSSLTATKSTIAIVTVTDPIDSDNAANVTVTGTGQAGATIRLVASEGTNTTSEYTATIGDDGAWTIAEIDVIALADGTITLTATASDSEDNTAQTTATATKDTAAPQLAISSVTSPINANSSANVTVSGTGASGTTITVVASDDANDTSPYSTTVNEDGTWTISNIDVSSLADGTVTFTAAASDSESDTAQTTATKDTVSPQLAISSVTSPISANSAANATVSGTGEAGTTITVVANDDTSNTSPYSTTVNEDGAWTISGIDVTALADGTITFTASTADAADNTAQTTTTSNKDATTPQLSISSVTNPINAAGVANVTISGTGEVGATIGLVATDGTNSTTNYTATIGEDGTWNITGIDVTALADGTITFTATATDAAGNTAQTTTTASKDTTAPQLAFSNITNPIATADVANVTISGTGEVGATIGVTATDGTNSTTNYTTTVGTDGTWTIGGIDATALADGTLTFNVTATDPSGNTSQGSATATKTTDTQPLAQADAAPPHTDLVDAAIADEGYWL